jgi:cation transport ATPase
MAAAFVPVVLAVALGAWAVRWALHGPGFALSPQGWFPSVAVLAVACPCAFSLAGVAAVTAITGACLQRGLLIRDPAALEAIPRVRTVVFDKTGTLSEGRISVERIAWLGPEREDLLPFVLDAERGAFHPVAAALRAFLHARGLGEAGAGPAAEDIPGLGRRLAVDGGTFAVGASGLFQGIRTPPGTPPGATLAWFGLDGGAAGCFVLADPVRPDAAAAVTALRARGLAVEVLSGDRPETTATVAALIGADAAWGGATLEEKVARIRTREAGGERILYVGDGTNDALAMAEATASVAVAGSTDEALAAADVVVLHGRLDAVPAAVDAARRLRRTVRGNLAWAFAFNLVFVPVAAMGLLRPIAAMLLMFLSSLGVLANSLRAARSQ